MNSKSKAALAAALCAGVLAACGGGGNDSHPEPEAGSNGNVPASATANIAAYFSYVGSLMATETGTPLGVNDVVPPTSETAAPSAVN